MIEFDDWVARRPFDVADRFLILGKGPTFAQRGDFDLTSYVTISLNHVIAEQVVDVAHMIDFEVAETCAPSIAANSRWLVMPRHPHIGFRPSLLPLEELIGHVPALAALEAEGRIVVYDLGGHAQSRGESLISARYFSSEAALNIAGHLGARSVATLGIDGGTQYAGTFSAVDRTTRLANGQPSFSLQFNELDRIASRHGVDLRPLVPPLLVYVGVQEQELIAARVLEYSIHKHASRPVRVIHLPTVTRQPSDPKKRQRTPFSFSRFLIPELAGYQGRALYVDSDMLVFQDIAELWDIPFDGATVLCTNQSFIPPQWRDNPGFHPGRQMSVMMLDCESLDWRIDDIIDRLDSDQLSYEELMFELKIVAPHHVRDGLPDAWNHLEHHQPGETKLLHYTAVPTQPWKTESNPLSRLWEESFADATEAGYVDAELVERHIKAGHVRGSLRPLVRAHQKPIALHSSALAAELNAARNALDLQRGPLAKVALRTAVERSRQSASWRPSIRRRARKA